MCAKLLVGPRLGVVVSFLLGVSYSFLKTLSLCFGSAHRSARLSRAQKKTKVVEWDSVEWEHYKKVVEWDSLHETLAQKSKLLFWGE